MYGPPTRLGTTDMERVGLENGTPRQPGPKIAVDGRLCAETANGRGPDLRRKERKRRRTLRRARDHVNTASLERDARHAPSGGHGTIALTAANRLVWAWPS